MRSRIARTALALLLAGSGPIAVAGLGKSGRVVVETLVVSSQTLHGLAEPSPPSSAAPTPHALTLDGPATYTIQPGDVLDFQSFDDPTISRLEILVLHDGTTTFPLINDVNLGGMTRDAAKALLLESYGEVFRDPQFSLSVRSSAGHSFYVLGDVARPAEFPYGRDLTVLEAVNIAGGIRVTGRADGEAYSPSQGTLTKAFVIRKERGSREVIEVDMRGLTNNGPHPSELPIAPGDIVYVPEGVNLVYVLGEIRSPNAYQLTENQTLLQLLSRAGGLRSGFARARHIVLARPIDDQHTEISVLDFRAMMKTGEDIKMQPGDVVWVPQKRLVRVHQFVQRFTGSISPILDLYTSAYNAVYLDRRTKAYFDSVDTNDGGVVDAVNTLQGLGAIFQDLPANLPQFPTIPPELLPAPAP